MINAEATNRVHKWKSTQPKHHSEDSEEIMYLRGNALVMLHLTWENSESRNQSASTGMTNVHLLMVLPLRSIEQL